MAETQVIKGIILPLEASQRKLERAKDTIDEWQRVAARMNELMPSFGPRHWRSKDSTLFHVVKKEFPDLDTRQSDAYQAAYTVAEAWGSWHSNGRPGGVGPSFGDGNQMRFDAGVRLARNENGYGAKLSLEPFDPEWFHINAGDYQREHLDEMVGDGLTRTSGLLRLENGRLFLHIPVKETVEVLPWSDVEHTAGVDIGEQVLYSVAVLNGDVQGVELETSGEFRHHREQLKAKLSRLYEKGKLEQAKQMRQQRRNYTDQMTHTAAKRIVEFVAEYDAPGIVLEDLTNYNWTADEPVHDWPYRSIQTKITHKATEAGIPVKKVHPAGTSITCRKCGHSTPENRDGVDFKCGACGYEVHADVNAAINIAAAG